MFVINRKPHPKTYGQLFISGLAVALAGGTTVGVL